MKRYVVAAAAAFLPFAASAQDITTYIGAAITSDYISGGYSLSDGPAFQPYVEIEHSSGVYAGLWLSTIDGAAGGVTAADNFEFDLYLGYRGEAGGLSYDLSYTRYIYDDSGDCCGDLILSLGYSLGESLSMNTDFTSDLEGSFSITQGFEYALPADFSLSGEVVWREDDYTSWNLGVGKYLSDTVSIDLRYHDSEDTDPLYALTINFDTDLGTLMGK